MPRPAAPPPPPPPENHDDDGAKPSELILEASRRNNLELLQEVLKDATPSLLNGSRDALGNTALHLAVSSGSSEIVDHLLDQKGLEVDPVNRLDGYTPLHLAVLYAGEKDEEVGFELVELLLDAGADPRVRSKGGRKALDMVDADDDELKKLLREAEYKIVAGNDVVNEDDGGSDGESD